MLIRRNRISAITIILFASFMAQVVYAMPNRDIYYVALDAGIFEGLFSHHYSDRTTATPADISETVSQNGYTGGIAFGYTYFYNCNYTLGGELSANVDTYYARFQAGASTAAFTDTSKIRGHFDLVFVPGLKLTQTLTGYVKFGASYALTKDRISSPAGTFPLGNNYSDTNNVFGLAAALGVRKCLTDRIFIFSEGTYHDYGTVSYTKFENFTAKYDHAAHINSYGVVLGVAYYI